MNSEKEIAELNYRVDVLSAAVSCLADYVDLDQDDLEVLIDKKYGITEKELKEKLDKTIDEMVNQIKKDI